jgi:hypothetical protein
VNNRPIWSSWLPQNLQVILKFLVLLSDPLQPIENGLVLFSQTDDGGVAVRALQARGLDVMILRLFKKAV